MMFSEPSCPKVAFCQCFSGADLVTIGGAIASDVHGKNHHRWQLFVITSHSIKLLVASGEKLLSAIARTKQMYFMQHAGGMGLTGVIIAATLQLVPISSHKIKQSIIPALDFENCIALLEQNSQSKYSVAWLDSKLRNKNFGRSVLFLGEHFTETENNKIIHPKRSDLSIPFSCPQLVSQSLHFSSFSMKLISD